jgi:phage terminase large subunit-like protein
VSFNGALVEAALLFAGQMPNIKGSEAGHLLRLMPWQKFVFASIFGLVERGTTTRRFRQAVVYVPRGNGKTTIAAPIGLYLTFVEGEGGAEGYAAAVTRDQARILFDAAQHMVRRSTEFRSTFGVGVERMPPTRRSIERIARQRYFVGATLPMKRASRCDRLQPFCPLTFQGCGSNSNPAS